MLEKLSTNKHQLFLIVLVRFLVVLTTVLLLALNQNYWFYPISEHINWCLIFYGLSAIVSIVRVGAAKQIDEKEVGFQLTLDLFFMTTLFYYAGGVANPFVSFLLFPLVVSASVMRRRIIFFHLLIALAFYGALFILPDPMIENGGQVDHSDHAHHMSSQSETSWFSMHIFGMWVNFALSSILVCTVVVMMSSRIKRQADKINQQNEEALKREQLISIATEAASVAHHMGTPLSTIAIIANELRSRSEFESAAEDLDVLESQVEICKKELAQLRAKAEWESMALPEPCFFVPLIAEVRNEFQLLKPQSQVEWKIDETLTPAKVVSTPSFRLALLNLINNAVEAADDQVSIEIYTMKKEIIIDIFDNGEGIDSALTGDVVVPVKSSKHPSVGLGLYLSHTSINQLGGAVSLSRVEPKGTLTQVRLPLAENPK